MSMYNFLDEIEKFEEFTKKKTHNKTRSIQIIAIILQIEFKSHL